MKVPQISEESQVKRVFFHYKKFYISLVIIFVCLLLLFMVIVPQLQQYSEQRDQIAQVEERLDILRSNIAFIATTSPETQDKQLALVRAALPEDKDYSGILFGVRSASAKAGVGIGDFTFQVGELSAKNVITKNLPTLALTLNVVGSPQGVQKFLVQLSQTLPLSNITEIRIDRRSAKIVAEFYYKPMPSLRINYAQPILRPSKVQITMLEQLAAWKEEQPLLDIIAPDLDSTSSGSTTFGF